MWGRFGASCSTTPSFSTTGTFGAYSASTWPTTTRIVRISGSTRMRRWLVAWSRVLQGQRPSTPDRGSEAVPPVFVERDRVGETSASGLPPSGPTTGPAVHVGAGQAFPPISRALPEPDSRPPDIGLCQEIWTPSRVDRSLLATADVRFGESQGGKAPESALDILGRLDAGTLWSASVSNMLRTAGNAWTTRGSVSQAEGRRFESGFPLQPSRPELPGMSPTTSGLSLSGRRFGRDRVNEPTDSRCSRTLRCAAGAPEPAPLIGSARRSRGEARRPFS